MSAISARQDGPAERAPVARENDCVADVSSDAAAITDALSAPQGRPSADATSQCAATLPVSRRAYMDSHWQHMAGVILFCVVWDGLLGFVLRPPASLLPMLLAATIAAATPRVITLEQRLIDRPGLRFALAAGSIGLPMLLTGAGLVMTTWFQPSGVKDVTSLLALVSFVVCIIFNRRMRSAVLALVGLWGGAQVAAPSAGGVVVLLIGGAIGLIAVRRSERQQRERSHLARKRRREQTRAEEILRDYEQTGQVWFWETDRRGAITYVSHSVGDALGRSPETLLGCRFSELFDAGAQGLGSDRTLLGHLTTRSAFADEAMRAATPGEDRVWSVNGRPIYDDFGNFAGFRGSGFELTERSAGSHDARLARIDTLTGLANRLQMSQLLERILSAPHVDLRACAVFLIDLDRFKHVNDTIGHPSGDLLLTQVAARLMRAVGRNGQVGRTGGDEFEVILAGHHDKDDLARLARGIIHSLSEPYSIDGHRVVIGASLGIALAPADGVTTEAVIRNADLALHAAKDGGRGRHHFYAADLHSDAEERRQLEQDLRDALIHGGLELYYQPIVHTSTERITGFEALLRWNHPERGPLSPGKFIPIAEDSGLITQIGEWVLRTACHDLSAWPEGIRVAVNVSALQFANPNLPAIITSALAAAQIEPSRVELEITESVFLNDDAGTDAMFAALKRVGVRLALDDFGTGYSSLGYLKKAPFDKIKIDQSFVRGATIAGSRNGAIIASIVSLAEALGMETTAEGVETLDELDFVRMQGCSHIQGFIYEQPLSLAQATKKLGEGITAIARGPRAARAVRHAMLRRIMLEHGGQTYHGTIRNLSATGAMVEGLWNVPPGTIFKIFLAEGMAVTATARWCQEDRMGVEFSTPLEVDASGRIAVLSRPQPVVGERILRKASG
ncbi:diguanylate cyclase (GGDEF)-like protein [Novosphingobium kunmingense]|uniref:Diguanylate cyclase (GGDEF)-like protein n=1 Tax=Novosphingobium kunmingense TaxID=1211806 RepID=A0A2N0I3M5_9SPHN|nr:EAL domain-containing protein [Novosphingobium kunmingense]PKB25773.1 diguanylate cyclase (GGDEF)-like protein [Novosphingobium kunmingense]